MATWWTELALWSVWFVVVLVAAKLRSRTFAGMVAVSMAIVILVSASIVDWVRFEVAVAMRVLLALGFVHFLALVRPRLRPMWFRVLVNWPSMWFAGACILAIPWGIVAIFTRPALWEIPFALGLVGIVQSLRNPRGVVRLCLEGPEYSALTRLKKSRREGSGEALRIFQITDPHLGPFMSVARLAAVCRRAVEHSPDLVLITGDLLTMESHGDPQAVAEALAPLKALKGRVYACFGNHDHEARATVREGLAAIGATLLVDEAAMTDTSIGPVQIVGADFAWRERKKCLEDLFEGLGPAPQGALRLLMLHDPGAFRHVPEGAANLTLSGHTHGGQIGLVSLGLPWTFVSPFGVPDHGAWGKGTNRLYVHRATGHYGFPFRLGVPGEESLLCVWRHADPAP